MNWADRIKQTFAHQRAEYHDDLRLAIEVLTQAFIDNLGLTPQEGKEWEFAVTPQHQRSPKELLAFVNDLIEKTVKKITEQNEKLKIWVKVLAMRDFIGTVRRYPYTCPINQPSRRLKLLPKLQARFIPRC